MKNKIANLTTSFAMLMGLNQGLINPHSLLVMDAREQLFAKRGSVNPVKLSLFPRDNRGETHQNRIALEGWSKRGFLIFDIDRVQDNSFQVLDWNLITDLKQISDSETTLTIDTTNLENENSPVLLVFLSNQQHTNDFLSTGTAEHIAKAGITLAVFEYPGTGASLGLPSRQNWGAAGAGAIDILSKRLHKKIFILGHSIGGGVVFDLPRYPGVVSELAGVLSFGGIFSLREASKTQVDWGSQSVDNFVNPIVTSVMVPSQLYDSREGVSILAKNQIPIFLMQGTKDPSVSYQHFELFTQEFQRLKSQIPQAKFETKVYPDYQHEVVFSNGLPEFYNVWSDITHFIQLYNKSALP